MDYTMYAIMVDGRKIEICTWKELSFFENILKGVEEGRFVERFTIEQNGEVVKEKVLIPKERGKSLCLRKD